MGEKVIKPEAKLAMFTDELRSVIIAEFGQTDKFKSVFRSWSLKSGDHLRPMDRLNIIIGLALRMTEEEIIKAVNAERSKDGLSTVRMMTLLYYRSAYGSFIDEVYIVLAQRIGEVYSFTDKLYRLGKYNELAKYVEKSVMLDVQADKFDDLSIKKGNFYLRILEKINIEMGKVSLATMMESKRAKETIEKDRTAIPELTGKDLRQIMKDVIKNKYAEQLPVKVEAKVEEIIEQPENKLEDANKGTNS
jgi:hypothetical protein